VGSAAASDFGDPQFESH